MSHIEYWELSVSANITVAILGVIYIGWLIMVVSCRCEQNTGSDGTDMCSGKVGCYPIGDKQCVKEKR
jgi:hypothetical protein